VKDVMLDFETLGNGKHAAVCQIGAVVFDRKTGEIRKEFKSNVDARSSVDYGGELDADTVYWWLSQSQEAIESFTKGDLEKIVPAFERLNDFLEDADAIWSHASFDFTILMDTMRRLRIKPKFSFRASRDIRTLVDLAGGKRSFMREGTHHDALADCRFQVRYCVDAFNRIIRADDIEVYE
jgi:hypothetical protein